MKNTLHFGLALTLTGLLSCSPKPEQMLMTVLGPIPAREMGLTLTHEHILVDFIGTDSTGYHRWNKQEVARAVKPYLEEIKVHQVSTFVECTPAYVGRDPRLLKTLSIETGMQIITNTGYYGANNNHYIPEHFYRLTAEELSQIWIDEYENGIEDSSIKPGFIKIAVDGDEVLSEEHVKIITAAALAHQQTGLVIASHTGPDAPAFEQISILQDHGIDPSCFIWVHAQHGSSAGIIKAAELGTWISLDNVNLKRQRGSKYDIAWYARRISDLKDAGYLNRVLISHDAGWYSPGEENGGAFRGYTGVFTDLVPALKGLGFTEKDINQILVINPLNAFFLRH